MSVLFINELKKLAKRQVGGEPVKVALLGDTSTQFLSIAIKGMGAKRGYNIDLFEADYNQIELQFMDPTSDLHKFGAKYIVVYQSSLKWNEKYSLMSPDEQIGLADERLEFVKNICEMTDSRIIYLNYTEIEDVVFGSYSNNVESSLVYQVRKMNFELMRLAQKTPNLFICDFSGLQNKFGRNFILDVSIYSNTEMVLSLDAVPYVASRVMDIIAAAEGKVKKCLIMDLDNTMWGGVIGDDGLEGIQIGHGIKNGKIFSELQMWAKKLKNRGIILCVCSKNDEKKAKEPFEKHPDMVLRLDDIAVFMANWETKVDNIRHIQQILNIGFDSMVFVDDSPFERNMVRENIPDLTVPELPEDPAEYLEYMYELNLFETASYSPADKDRTRQYQVEAERSSFARSFTNEADFLKSLKMVSKVGGFDKFDVPRVAQLSQRSNQFNLRTVRYTEADIAALGKDPDVIDLTFTLKDKFGDNGLIAVVIMKKLDAETLFVDTWFMSCRVLKRGMESFTLNTMVAAAKAKGYKKIVGEYLPTLKNNMVKGHYTNLGFTKMEGTATERYILDVESYHVRECYIEKK